MADANTSVLDFSQDIEIIVHDEDQERAFIILTAHGLLPPLPDNSDRPLHSYTNFVNWRQEYASPSQYRDGRRLRHGAPIYETPPHPADSDPKTTFTPRMFIILYSAEFADLAPFSSQHDDSPGDTQFISLTALQKSTDIPNCLVPTSQSLVESENHVLLQGPNHPSPTWCQHAAQLASLVYSRSCPGGMDGLADFFFSAVSTVCELIPEISEKHDKPWCSEADAERLLGTRDIEQIFILLHGLTMLRKLISSLVVTSFFYYQTNHPKTFAIIS